MKPLALALLLPFLAAPLHAQHAAFGNATCIGHVPDNPTTPALRNKHCTFLIGDPTRPDQLKLNALPPGEPLLVLGRSGSLEGTDHGATWFLVKTREGRQGYVPEYDLRCTATPDQCAAIGDKSVP